MYQRITMHSLSIYETLYVLLGFLFTEAVIVGVAENVAPHVVNTVGTMEGPVTATLLEDMTCLLPLSG